MKILVTAFEPFRGDSINSSYETLRLLPDTVGGHTVVKELLPVVYPDGGDRVAELIGRHQPDAVVCMGQAAGAPKIRLERFAINVIETGIGDNAGRCIHDEKIDPAAPSAYESTLPCRAMVEACDPIAPAALSYHAGAYLCNCIFFRARQAMGDKPCGFIHLPILDIQNDFYKMNSTFTARQLADAIAAALAVLA